MVRQQSQQSVEYKCIREGHGNTRMQKLLNGAEELYGKGRMFNLMTLPSGNSIGRHTHEGDNEVFYFLSGVGEYGDDGTVFSAPGRGRSGGDSDGTLALWLDWQHAWDDAKFNHYNRVESNYDLISLGFSNEPNYTSNHYARFGGFGGRNEKNDGT